jgi:hypothetical protein
MQVDGESNQRGKKDKGRGRGRGDFQNDTGMAIDYDMSDPSIRGQGRGKRGDRGKRGKGGRDQGDPMLQSTGSLFPVIPT